MRINLNKINDITVVMFLTSVFTLPRTFIVIKLIFLFIYLISFCIQSYRKKKLYINKKLFAFYIVIILLGLFSSFVGYINRGGIAGIFDNLRLWVVWSICFILIITMFLQQKNLLFFHNAVVLSGILISIINAIGFCELFYGLGIVPEFILTEMDLRLGLHEGYMHITTENITSLFFIVPYLITLQFRKDGNGINNWVTKLSLFLTFSLAVSSGRRALWLCIMMTPFIILVMSFFLSSVRQIKTRYKNFTYVLFFMGIFGIAFIATSDEMNIPTLVHLKEAFSAEDERSIQKVFLVNSFLDYPFFGSGFGVGAGYQRSENRVWLYELTYHQLLFNFGLIGTLLLLFLYGSFFYLIIDNFKKNRPKDIIPFGILVGIVSFAIGAYSNPYFGSFDFLIYIAMVPYLASFKVLNNYTEK